MGALVDLVKAQLASSLPQAQLKWEPNANPKAGDEALVVDRGSLLDVCRLLKDDSALQLDFLSNLCAVDWLATPGPCLEVVYHLFSTTKRHGPLTLKCRTPDRSDCKLPSVTPLWRSAEYQEREAYDLYGVVFEGHPDLRRILMWDEFTDFPMRKDYKSPDDYEWEPTPHDDVVKRVKERQA